jgi:hypothetical protein
VSFSVTGLPTGATAVFNPATLAAGSGPASVSLQIALPSQSSSARPIRRPFGALAVALGLVLLPFAGRLRQTSRRLRRTACLLVLGLACLAAMAGLTGCGGNSAPAAQTYTMTVTATAGSLTHTATLDLTVN